MTNTWDSTKKSPSLTLSNGDLTVSSGAGNLGQTRAVTGFTTGKCSFSVTVDATAADIRIGFAYEDPEWPYTDDGDMPASNGWVGLATLWQNQVSDQYTGGLGTAHSEGKMNLRYTGDAVGVEMDVEIGRASCRERVSSPV